ncbi:MAG: carboxypeptidase-like regulatory domain-containing protein [Bacteroidetes bacterium]|nr:carboxypeptidase-like regulatory domain-containing protein [Bacteroidota bacterium]
MKKLIFLLACAMCVILCSNCSKEPPNMFGTIHGVVIDKETGESIAIAGITLSPGGGNAVTGADGRFEFVNLDPQQYIIAASAAGYRTDRKIVTAIVGEIVSANFLLIKNP